MLDKGSHLETKFSKGYTPCQGQHMHMPRAEFMRLLAFAGFQQCHICRRRRYLLVDHEHRSPWTIRGLLCNDCNMALGRYEHGYRVPTDLAAAMMDYIRNPPAKQLGITRNYRPYYEGQLNETFRYIAGQRTFLDEGE